MVAPGQASEQPLDVHSSADVSVAAEYYMTAEPLQQLCIRT